MCTFVWFAPRQNNIYRTYGWWLIYDYKTQLQFFLKLFLFFVLQRYKILSERRQKLQKLFWKYMTRIEKGFHLARRFSWQILIWILCILLKNLFMHREKNRISEKIEGVQLNRECESDHTMLLVFEQINYQCQF